MAEYRIRKGEHEYVAQQIETLQELLGRGLIGPADEVSVDGGPFLLVEDLLEPGGEGSAESDLWRHWNDAREASSASGVLSDFLDEIAPTVQTASRPLLSPAPAVPPPTVPAAPPVLDLPDLAVDSLPNLSDDALHEAEAPPPDAPSPEPAPDQPSRQQLRLVEPDAPASPVSFADWVDAKGGGAGDSALKDFGKVDDGIVLHGRKRRGANWWRTTGLLTLATLAVVFWHTWVRTIAETAYPREADLIASLQGDGPKLPGVEPSKSAPDQPVSVSARDAEQRLRSRVAGDIRQFGDRLQLEDAIFQELSNLQASPVKVRVESLRSVGSGDFQRDRPTEANVTVLLAGVAEGDIFEAIRERLTLTWLVIAKYGNQGHVKFQTVTVRFGAPSASTYTHPGHLVLALGTRNTSVTDLLLMKQ